MDEPFTARDKLTVVVVLLVLVTLIYVVIGGVDLPRQEPAEPKPDTNGAYDQYKQFRAASNAAEARQHAQAMAGAPGDAGPLLLEAAQDERFPYRSVAVDELGALRYSAAVAYLVKLIHHPDPVLRRSTLTALRAINDPACIPELAKAIQQERDLGTLLALVEIASASSQVGLDKIVDLTTVAQCLHRPPAADFQTAYRLLSALLTDKNLGEFLPLWDFSEDGVNFAAAAAVCEALTVASVDFDVPTMKAWIEQRFGKGPVMRYGGFDPQQQFWQEAPRPERVKACAELRAWLKKSGYGAKADNTAP